MSSLDIISLFALTLFALNPFYIRIIDFSKHTTSLTYVCYINDIIYVILVIVLYLYPSLHITV